MPCGGGCREEGSARRRCPHSVWKRAFQRRGRPDEACGAWVKELHFAVVCNCSSFCLSPKKQRLSVLDLWMELNTHYERRREL